MLKLAVSGEHNVVSWDLVNGNAVTLFGRAMCRNNHWLTVVKIHIVGFYSAPSLNHGSSSSPFYA
jgi:hypothetical protein